MSKKLRWHKFCGALMAVLLGTLGAAAQTAAAPAEQGLRFSATEFYFGKIPQGKPVYHNFTLTNAGTKVARIDNVQAACGCTTPEWSKDPIAPGATATIRVGYNAAAEGPFDKTITVMWAGTTQVLHIRGEVWKTPSSPAPPNASVQFLKKQLGQ